ncbi:unnamed protein product [Brugia timori]|uniref:Uncharacterized protein n=1 Tax=Brugia timori TaxID=42155 RepID=A0A0R3QEX0_9BILA|nr:unnamed protein product [Brugia timori]
MDKCLSKKNKNCGRNSRQSYQRGNEQNKSTNDEEKPVMNLFDPCKVPTGRSYFTVILPTQRLPVFLNELHIMQW